MSCVRARPSDSATLGYERRLNPALQVASRDEFIRRKVAEHHYKPPYFSKMEELNQQGSAASMAELPNPVPVGVERISRAMEDGLQLVDIREPEAYAGAAVPGSLCLPLGMLPAYAGYLLSYDRPIGLVADGGARVLDVRKQEEWDAGHVDGATHVFLGHLPECLDDVPRDASVVTFCGSGRRAMVAASILQNHGFDGVACNLGSMAAWKAVGAQTVAAAAD